MGTKVPVTCALFKAHVHPQANYFLVDRNHRGCGYAKFRTAVFPVGFQRSIGLAQERVQVEGNHPTDPERLAIGGVIEVTTFNQIVD
jgi:hypothetical protein